MNSIIPIFPLNIVLFPGAKYPLHIFEERYKKMVSNSIETGEGFGMVSKIDLDISHVGCYVIVDKVLKEYENGSMDILVKGIERFEIITKSYNADGYMEAAINTYSDSSSSEYDRIVYEKAVTLFREIIDKTSIDLGKSFWNNLEKTSLKSFKLAEKSGLNIKQQQSLLSFQSENKRLGFLLEHFEKIDDYLDQSQAIREIIAGDGYLN